MRRTALALSAPLLLLLAGCGGPPVNAVEGTVTLAGDKPAGNLTLTFNPVSASDKSLTGLALTDDAGKFRVKCDDGRNGLPPGRYVVTVFDNNLAAEDDGRGKRPVNRVNKKYATADEKTNPLVVTVEAGKTGYDLKLD